MAWSLFLAPPCQLLVLAGPEHGRTIPLAEARQLFPYSSGLGSHTNFRRFRFHFRLAKLAQSRHAQIAIVLSLIARAANGFGSCAELRKRTLNRPTAG